MPTLPSEPFGLTADGRPATLYTLRNQRLCVRITDYGGRLVSIVAPDRNGRPGEVLLGFDDVHAYATIGGSFGSLLGRYANRIAGAGFTLDGHDYRLSANDGAATLHGGPVGFNKVFWTVTGAAGGPVPSLELSYLSADGDQGFPGEVAVTATYRLDGDQLTLGFTATTTKPTVINLSSHPYFNLAGADAADVLDHEVTIPADGYLPTDAKQIPTGIIAPVAGTPFDFRQPTRLGAHIRQADPQLFHGFGYDHCFVLRPPPDSLPRAPCLAVHMRDPASGRVLAIHTDHPGVQIYTGNKLTGAFAGHGGVIYRQSAGVAVEPQAFPDAPNQPGFPSTVLRPGETYSRVIRYDFATD